MNRGVFFDAIEEKLNILATRINARGKLNILDLHQHSENFYRFFLVELYGWDIINVNATQLNVEAIDLLDHTNQLVFQVSATSSKAKIESSLSKNLILQYQTYTFKFISIANNADDLRNKNYANPHAIAFTPSKDIIDKNSILTEIKGLDIDKLKGIYEFIKKELGSPEIDLLRLETNLASVINILSKEQLDQNITDIQVNTYEIDRKISFNALSNAKGFINEFSIHYFRLDRIYATFDQQGTNRSTSVLWVIRSEYLKIKGSKTADDLFFEVARKILERVLNSSNYTIIPYEELEFCINILVVDAFVRCKIFENPIDYKYAAT